MVVEHRLDGGQWEGATPMSSVRLLRAEWLGPRAGLSFFFLKREWSSWQRKPEYSVDRRVDLWRN